ncbi:UDP-N-acetylmuramate dehydrogenase [Candidatus Collierbacteria bacterium]|nr:UDP-N-acetylmuramate dehydrogenase [Candidatus Collierbacteria bacterium]
MKYILRLSKNWGERVIRDEVLAPYTYFKIGGPADYFVTAKSSKELEEIVLMAESSNVPWFILGGGSNILVGDLGFRGLVIKNEAESVNVETGELTAESGIKMSKLAAFSIKNGLAGLEVFMSVPGTLGGAIFNNSHFRPEKNEFIGNLVESVELLYKGLALRSRARPYQTITVNKDWFKFKYDHSRLHDEPGVILKVKLRLKSGDPEMLKATSMKLMKERNASQPIGQLSCGCMFKNPAGFSAGQLIDNIGMKGKKIGGAMISDKHANFVINTGGAKAKEVIKLMDLIKTAVKSKSGIDFKPEIFMVGEF